MIVTYFAAGSKADGAHSVRSNLLLDSLVTRGNSLEGTQAPQSAATTETLVWQHSADSPLEDLGGCTVMEGTTSRIDVTSLSQESQELQLVPIKLMTD